MYLYKFELNIFKEVNITRTVVEVVEKPKTYITISKFWKSRILKSDVGVLSGYDNGTLYLLEDDIKKAIEIFIHSLKSKIEKKKTDLEVLIKWANKEIADYEKSIEALSKEVEGE